MADDLLSKYVEPSLSRPSFVIDYPTEISPLAREHRSKAKQGLVERFEAFAGGMEIANGFSELIDSDTQRARFAAQERVQLMDDEAETMPYDEEYVQALEQGMPPTGGRRPRDRPPRDAADRTRFDPRGRAVPGAAHVIRESRGAGW